MILIIALAIYFAITLLVIWGSGYFGCDSRLLKSESNTK